MAGGENFFGDKLGCSTWGINDQIIMPRAGVFHKYIFQYSFLIFPLIKEYTIEGKALTELMEVLILEINS